MNEKTKEIIELIAAFLVDTTGNEIFEKWKVKRKISKILKEDCKNIERILGAIRHTDLYNLVEEFIMYSAFKEVSFYSPMDLTVEQEEKLWKEFSNFIKNENNDNYVNVEYKEKIIRCINLHNKAINSTVIDIQGNLQMKMIQSQQNSLNDIINILNIELKLQDEDEELDFSIKQLNMIMKSYRFDIKQLRKMQIISICGAIVILLFMSIFIPLSLKYIRNIYSIITICLFFYIVGVFLLMFWKYILRSTQRLENEMEEMRALLWNIHIELYRHQIEEKYTTNIDSK